MAGMLEILREECVLLREKIVSTNYDGSAGKLGQSVNVAVASDLAVTPVTPGPVVPASADMNITSKVVTVNQWQKAIFHVNPYEYTVHEMESYVPRFCMELARQLARNVNQAIMAEVELGTYGYAGTAGTNPFTGSATTNPLSDLAYVLRNQLCPMDRLSFVMGLHEEQALKKIANLTQYLQFGNRDVIQRGVFGEVLGFKCLVDRDVVIHTAGSVTGAGTVVTGVNAIGSTSIGMTTTGGGDAIALKKGDVITFSTAPTDVQTYAVQADLTVGGTSTGTLTILPGLKVATGGGETLTVKASRSINFGGDLENAIALVMRMPPEAVSVPLPGDGNAVGNMELGQSLAWTDPVANIPMRLNIYAGYHQMTVEASILYGTRLVDGRRIAQLAGSTTA
jgi:hypothetical protein